MSAYYLTLYLRVYSARGEVFFTWLNRLIGVRETGELGQVFRDFYVASAPRIILLLICSVCILYAVLDLYAGRRSLLRRKVAADVVLANIAALLIFYTYFYLTRNRHHPRSFFGVLMVVNAILCVGFRGLLEQVLIWARRTYAFDVCRVVVMESPDVPEDMLTYIDKVQPHGLICVGRVAYGDGDFSTRLARMRAEVSRRKAHMVIAFDASMDVGQIMELLEACNELGIAAKVGCPAVTGTRACRSGQWNSPGPFRCAFGWREDDPGAAGAVGGVGCVRSCGAVPIGPPDCAACAPIRPGPNPVCAGAYRGQP